MRFPATYLLATISLLSAALPARGQSATALLDTAIARMGGESAARGVKRARFEMMTQWQRTSFDTGPYADQPVYESHSDLRDYELGAWRNTRRFNNGRTTMEIVDVVRDGVAIRRSPGGPGGVASPSVAAPGAWVPLNIAYVDEWREQRATAPERLLMAAREAHDLHALSDTIVGGAPHARVSATVDGFRTTLLLRRSTGFLRAVRFRTAEPNDFGLVPWGNMDVEIWYGGWRKQPDGLVYPFQWDVRRVGAPYKRMTVLAATFNQPAMPDSFVVSDSLRAAYLDSSTLPMHEVPLDSARIVETRFASFNTPGAPVGAVKLGDRWMLLETGQAPSSAERAMKWLTKMDANARMAGALVTMPATGNGGVPWLAMHDVRVHAAPGAKPYMDAVLRGHGAPSTNVTRVSRGTWLRVGGDSLWLEPMDLPDLPGALVAYAPSLEWVYSAAAANPLQLDLILARAREKGWRVSRFGSARGAMSPLPPAQQLSRGPTQ
ncbi:MAG TPA: hypothetical protein VFI52_10200 [Gemmatimonadaceae bacterium]|nr:hypothetical protein [Gemmatimonadaceae bacterium]